MSDITSTGSAFRHTVTSDATLTTGQATQTANPAANAGPSVSTNQSGLPNAGGTQQASQEQTTVRLLRRNHQRAQENTTKAPEVSIKTTELTPEEVSQAFASFSKSQSSGKNIAELLVPLMGMLQISLREQALAQGQAGAAKQMEAAGELKAGAADMRKGGTDGLIFTSIGAGVGALGSLTGLKWGGQITSAASQSAAQGVTGGGSYLQTMAQAGAQEHRAASEQLGSQATLASTMKDTKNSQQQQASGTNNAILSLVNELIRNEQEGKQAISSKFR